MLAWTEYEGSLCSGCHQPISHAWHWDQEGWYDVKAITCHGCTAIQNYGTDKNVPAERLLAVDTRDYVAKPLPAS